MLAPSRRIFLYWLLLLLPTLAVGAGALYLLQKEQARLDEQAKAAAGGDGAKATTPAAGEPANTPR